MPIANSHVGDFKIYPDTILFNRLPVWLQGRVRLAALSSDYAAETTRRESQHSERHPEPVNGALQVRVCSMRHAREVIIIGKKWLVDSGRIRPANSRHGHASEKLSHPSLAYLGAPLREVVVLQGEYTSMHFRPN
jgi:hypothetical protein